MGGKRMASQRIQTVLGLALLASLILLALLQGPTDAAAPYDLNSAGPDGLRALRLWLQEMGYTVAQTGQERFFLPPDTDLLFIYPSQRPFRDTDAAAVHDWVLEGGTLVLVGSTSDDVYLKETFQTAALSARSFGSELQQVQPLLPDLASEWVTDAGRQKLDLDRASQSISVLARTNGDVTAAVQELGRGTVWHFTTDHDFVNDSLSDRQQAALIPALLRRVPDGGNILFDTYHMLSYGKQTSNQIASIRDWLYRTYTGLGLLFGIGVVLVFLLLEGWRLGPPLPEQTGVQRREAAEYVEAMAGLQRRAHLGAAVARHHKRRLKAALGRTHHVSPDLADVEFVHRLERSRGYLSPQQIREVAAVLRGLEVSTDDRNLIQLVFKVDRLLNQVP